MNFTPPIELQEEPEHINMTPMIDVVFLLVIFFLTSAQLSVGGREDITLPVASEARPSEKLDPESITVDIKPVPAGTVYSISGKAFSYPELMARLSVAAESATDREMAVPPIIIHADQMVSYRDIQRLMFDCSRMGYEVFDFKAVPEEEIR